MKFSYYKYLYIVLIITAPFLLNAQNKSIEQDKEEEEEEVKAVATEGIPDFNREVGLKILDIKNQINSGRKLEEETIEVDSISRKIKFDIKKTDSLNIDNLTLDKLEKLDRHWQAMATELAAINTPLDKKIKAYGEYFNIIDGYYQVSLLTSIDIKKLNINNELKDNLRNTKNDLREFRSQIKETQNQYLKLKSVCNEQANNVSLIINNIKVARSKIVRNLLIPEQETLWKAIKEYQKDTIVISEESNVAYAKGNIKSYFKKNRFVPFFVVAIFLLFWIITRLLKTTLIKANLLDEVNKNNATKAIINKPILISSLFTWFIFAIGFYLPIEVNAIWLFLMLPVLILTANELFQKQSLANMLIFSSFYMFRAFEFLYDETTLLARILTLALDLISIVILLRFTKAVGKDEMIIKIRWFLRMVFFVLIGLIVGSFLFNILGNVRLSNILIVGSIDVVITGILLLFSYHIFYALIKLFIISPQAKRINVIKNHVDTLLKNIRKIIILAATIYWMMLSLQHFGIREEIMAWLKKFYYQEIHFGNSSFALNNLVAFFLAIYLSIVISRILRLILEEDVFTRSKTDKGTSSTIILLFRYSVITLGFLFAMSAAGIQMEKISIIIGALGVGIGFGLQDIFNNLVSGIILAIERPIAVDDIIEVGSLTGIVKEIGFRSSRVRTYDGAEVIVPNGDIVSNQMINWTLSDRKRRLKIDFGVSYDSNPEEVIEVMNEITFENPNIVQDPAPRPRFVEFGDSSLNFQLLFWITDYENSFGIGTETMLSLFSKLKERGIEIPFPQRDIRIVDVTKDKKGSKLTE